MEIPRDEETDLLQTNLLVIEDVVEYGKCASPDSSSSGITTVIFFSTLVAICGSYAFGTSVGYSSPAESGIMKDLGLTEAEYTVFGSILTFGAMIGAVMSGKTADLIGRKGAMWLSDIFCILGWLALVFAKGAWMLDVGRFLTGFGIGNLAYVVPVYIAEIAPQNIRGGVTSASQLMITCGTSLTIIIGAVIPWRDLAIMNTAPCLLQLIGLFFIPESPRWLAMVDRWNESKAALQLFRGKGTDISEDAATIKDFTEHLQHLSKNSILDMFQEKYSRLLIVAVGLMVLQEFGGLNGFSFYTSSIFDAAGFPVETGILIAGVVQIPMNALGVLLMDKSGRRPILLVAAAGTFTGSFITGLAFLMQDIHWWTEITPILVLIGVSVFLGFFALGMGGIPWLIMSEIFPINIKGSAGSLVNVVSWLGSWVVSYTFNYLFEWSTAGTFFIFATIGGFGIVFVVKMVRETKGRTLEEIQSSFAYPAQ